MGEKTASFLRNDVKDLNGWKFGFNKLYYLKNFDLDNFQSYTTRLKVEVSIRFYCIVRTSVSTTI